MWLNVEALIKENRVAGRCTGARSRHKARALSIPCQIIKCVAKQKLLGLKANPRVFFIQQQTRSLLSFQPSWKSCNSKISRNEPKITQTFQYARANAHIGAHKFTDAHGVTYTYTRTCTRVHILSHPLSHTRTQTNRQTDKQTNRQTDKHTCMNTNTHTHTNTDRQIDRQRDRETDKQTDRQTDR